VDMGYDQKAVTDFIEEKGLIDNDTATFNL
jgi:hypothetical protein